jgi:hypothetical protein
MQYKQISISLGKNHIMTILFAMNTNICEYANILLIIPTIGIQILSIVYNGA